MMRSTLALWIIACAGIATPAGADVIPLAKAAKKKIVRVRASANAGYSKLRISVQNLKNEPVTVTVFGSMFIPRSGSIQRLGVPRLDYTGAGTEISIAARSTWKGSLPS